jgi:hypothetical protein
MDCGVGSDFDAAVIAVDRLMPADLCILEAICFLLGREDLDMTSRKSSGSMRAESAVEPTRSENITVTWRRSALSLAALSVARGASDSGVGALAGARRAAIVRRCPTVPTPKSFKSSAVRLGRTFSLISFSRNVASIPDLGPGKGTYGSSSLYVGDQNRRLFLRSAKPVAARIEREHQWPAETVLSEGHRLVGALASLSEQGGSSAQRTTT